MADFQEHIITMIPRLRRFAISLAGNLSDGDDLLQNALERALSRRATYKPEHNLDSWLFKITQNIWIDQKRSEKRRGPVVDIDDAHHLVGENGEQRVEQRDMSKKVLAAIDALPEDQRLIVTYVLVDGQSYKEAAEILDIPVGTVMSRLYRARKALETLIHNPESAQKEKTPEAEQKNGTN
ncbi:MAG: RNA polymerase sigma factor [Kordiimonadaceae bacterium]|nr:RNA polymerase sigma factor [Kordiimonadaceae bacterium]